MWGNTGGRLATLRESHAPALLPSALALAAAARQAVVVPSRHLVHCGAHRSLAGVCAGVHCAGAAHRHACVWRCILRTAGACDQTSAVACIMRSALAGCQALPRPSRQAGCLLLLLLLPTASSSPWPGRPCAASAVAMYTRARTQTRGLPTRHPACSACACSHTEVSGGAH